MKSPRVNRLCAAACALLLIMAFAACGSSGGGAGGGGGGNPPAAPTGVVATAGNLQVVLTWSASASATMYNAGRSTTSGGPYTKIASTAATTYTDSGLTNGTTYYYVVAASNANGASANSTQVSAKPIGATTAVNVMVDVMTNRHPINPYVYGGAFPKSAADVTNSGTSVVRWGGNAASTYNWKLSTYNADNDYYFEDFTFCGLGSGNSCTDGDSIQFINDVKAAGSVPLMTLPMLPWVAQSPEVANPPNNHWSFSVAKYGAQCAIDPFNTDAGNGIVAGTCNGNPPTYLAADPNDAYYPLLDGPPQAGDPANSLYRKAWVAAIAAAMGPAVPHFYDMDNEIDIWGGTHRDIHPNGSGYNELRDTFLTEAHNLGLWDARASRLGPVSCCWYFYWNLPSTTDNKSNHAGIDFLPWWLNEIYWQDQISGGRSLDVFDVHAYPDADTAGLNQAQQRALATKIYRDYWDPTFTSPAQYIAKGGFSIEPLDSIPFRIPRMKALVNSIYPGTSLGITEWSAAFAGESDFSTALGDADAYGIMGRENVAIATRWTAPDPANPNYQALKLFTNYDGAHSSFGSISISATHDANPDLFSVYAATNVNGTIITALVLNKDPVNAAQVTFTGNGFTPSQITPYTLSMASPYNIVAGPTQAFSSTATFPPYSATLVVVTGTPTNQPPVEWALNPAAIMVPSGGSVSLNPKLINGSMGSITLGTPIFQAGISVTVNQPAVTTNQQGSITVTGGNTPGFYHFAVPASDGTTEGGWVVVGKAAATLAKTAGDAQVGSVGTTLPLALKVTLSPVQSGGTAKGASVFFTASAGSLTNVAVGGEQVFNGSKVIAVTDASGIAQVMLTLPATAGPVTVTAEGPYGLGHPVVSPFTATAQ